MVKDNFISTNKVQLIKESEYPKFIQWVKDHEDDMIDGTYINAYLCSRKDKLSDWFA